MTSFASILEASMAIMYLGFICTLGRGLLRRAHGEGSLVFLVGLGNDTSVCGNWAHPAGRRVLLVAAVGSGGGSKHV
jgi:hypothetical protein